MTNPDFTAMLLLTYTPRAGTDLGEYDAWLRSVDNPFFNGVPGIALYTNWQVSEGAAGLPFSHFDFMGLDSIEAAAAVWQREDVKAFTAEWRRLWGQGPDAADLSVNAHVYLFENAGRAGIARTRTVRVQTAAAVDPETPPRERWDLVRPVRGEPRFRHMRIVSGDAVGDGFAGRLIAGPY